MQESTPLAKEVACFQREAVSLPAAGLVAHGLSRVAQWHQAGLGWATRQDLSSSFWKLYLQFYVHLVPSFTTKWHYSNWHSFQSVDNEELVTASFFFFFPLPPALSHH